VINELYRSLLKKVAKEAVPLTDAFGFSDRGLGSALGRKDGRAYEALWEAVQRNPVNTEKWQKETYEVCQTSSFCTIAEYLLTTDISIDYHQEAIA
jgi:hypothetical protein